jgi:hypothetical protein
MPLRVSETRPATAPARLKRRNAECEGDPKSVNLQQIVKVISRWKKLVP